jgi:uncharacterized protein (TIGR01777 family)
MIAANRQTVSAADLATRPRPLTVAVSGATGLVGRAVSKAVTERRWNLKRLVRRFESNSDDEIVWNPQTGVADLESLGGVDAVVHLAGENIASGRWTAAKKQQIRDSRVQGTAALCRSLVAMPQRPRVLVCASAIGYYGDRGDRGEQALNEREPPGRGFLPEVCAAWEQAAQPAVDAGIRVVWLRIGIVLSAEGGALRQMLPPFRFGLGGRIGDGRQYWSWIALPDLVRAVLFAVENESLCGAVNAVAPEAVTNAEFTHVLGRVLRRPTLIPMPGFAARLALGQMADDLLLSSIRVVPERLQHAGFEYEHPELDGALRALLPRSAAACGSSA